MTATHADLAAPRPIRMTTWAWIATGVIAATASIVCAMRIYPDPAMPACCYFAAVGTVLSAIDVAVMRLPDFLTLPSYPALLLALAWASSTADDTQPLFRGVEAAVVVLAAFAVQHLTIGVGLGDVKLAGLIGLLLGYFGWTVLFQGLFVGCTIGALWAAALRLRGSRDGYVPLGPALVVGTLVAVLA
ncbi:prepilin peptidase [Catenulispora pinisilvae]|uniref:prepilin peptidase n=2 Tax=Catenulispora pinisilvae TaxID=2705253 RepID=UPI0018919298|nr:prepilin peptidase [Catenulispora pinisilvae]